MTGRLLVCMLFAVGACHGPPDDRVVDDPGLAEPAADTVDDTRAPGIMFAADLVSAKAGEFQVGFVIPDQIDIITRVPVPADTGIQLLKLDLYGPSGMLYQTKWRAFTTDSNVPARVEHPTLLGGVPVQQVIEDNGPPHLLLGIPIAGTHITRYRLIGVFRAEARIGVEDTPPTAVGHFEIMLPDGMGM